MLHGDFAITLTDAEAALGFCVRAIPTYGYVVVLELSAGLLAVKTLRNGQVEYVLCDRELAPMYAPAQSLDELRTRFGARHAS